MSEPDFEYFFDKLMFATPKRTRQIYESGLKPFRQRFEGARVLDLACNIGIWSHAALCLGAAHVTAVDFHAETLEKAKRNVISLGAKEGSYTQIRADVRDAVKTLQQQDFDIVLCMGILYHFVDPVSFLWDIAAMEPRFVFVDTSVSFRAEPVLEYVIEAPASPENASGVKYNFPGRGAVVGILSESLVWKMMIEFGYDPITRNLAPLEHTGYSPNGYNKKLIQWFQKNPEPRTHKWRKNTAA